MLLRMCLAPTGEYQRLYFHLNQVSQVESAAVDANSRLQLLLSLAHVENICGNVRLSRAKAAEARLLAERAGQRGAHVAASYFLAQALEFGADYAGCVELCATTLADLGPSARHERFQLTGTSSVLFSSLSAHAHAFLDNHAEAERHGRLAVEVAQETQRPFDLGVASFGLGWARFVTGDLRGAMGCFETAMANVRDHRLQLLESMIDCRLRYLRIVVGGEAPDVVQPEQACREAAAMPHIRCWANLLWAMAEMHAGRLDRAARIVDDAIPVARARHYRGNLAWAYAVLAEIRWRASAPDRHVIGHRARQLLEKTGLAWKFADAAWMARDLAA
jgi:tetratricopeptide (TPR) repeat protein